MLGSFGKYSTKSSHPALPEFARTWFFLLVSAVGATHVNPARKGWESAGPSPEHRRCDTNHRPQGIYEISSSDVVPLNNSHLDQIDPDKTYWVVVPQPPHRLGR
jgi:hypothetical protein